MQLLLHVLHIKLVKIEMQHQINLQGQEFKKFLEALK